ncbi:hypothetical protein [Pseudomonas tohonis]|uniref:hypothetical protein n=1 Tax=Pseudomonas tohonis TaxID=2725477 RepID=UPI001F2EED7E|nr:hypothetical protein [Pseudomonas tohonis]
MTFAAVIENYETQEAIEAHKESIRRLAQASRNWDRATAQRGLRTIDNINKQLEELERGKR